MCGVCIGLYTITINVYVSHERIRDIKEYTRSAGCDFGFLFSLGRMAICLNNLLMILKPYRISLAQLKLQ